MEIFKLKYFLLVTIYKTVQFCDKTPISGTIVCGSLPRNRKASDMSFHHASLISVNGVFRLLQLWFNTIDFSQI